MFFNLLSKDQQDRINKRVIFSGIDSLDHCLDKNWFKKCRKKIFYNFNNWGFRDDHCEKIENNFVVIGDSFSMGLGQPYEETWPYKLENLLGERVIKITADGASNDWILTVFERLNNVKYCFIMLSFVSRFTTYNSNYVIRNHYRLDPPEEIYNSTKDIIKKLKPAIITAVPGFVPHDYNFPIDNLVKYDRLINKPSYKKLQDADDLARDGFHFGDPSSAEIAENMYKEFQNVYK
jgi:hypothetical protein